MTEKTFEINATPEKRLFMSIIADYDLQTSICELVDNAIDHWTFNGRNKKLNVRVFLDSDRQIIAVEDDAGGVPKDEIEFLVTPGASREVIDQELIGNFGVGGKRAGVALGSRTEVLTRCGDQQGHKFVIDDAWLAVPSWMIPIAEVSDLNKGSTKVRITELRQGIDGAKINELKSLLSEVYGQFLGDECSLKVNGEELIPTRFDTWAYPPSFSPQMVTKQFSPSGQGTVTARITGGLLYDRNPMTENYGVYFYCNDRLIVSHLRSYEVGFHKGAAGTTHPDASLCRVIVELNGPPELMPWTSSKTRINWSNATFLEIRDEVIALATRFSKVSRRLKNDRETEVYPFQEGKVDVVSAVGSGTIKKIVELPVPRGRKKNYAERLIEQNSKLTADAPWTLGLVEAMSFVDIIIHKKHETRNRIALIVLDSNFEIGLKEYLVHLTTKHYSDKQIATLFDDRRTAIQETKSHVTIDEILWQKARHYYDRRNKLIHERATIQITDTELEDYRNVVEDILAELFGFDFSRD